MYVPYEREKSRQRSRDRDRKNYNRSPSQDEQTRKARHSQYRESRPKGKRVKFDEMAADVRVFRKEDEPSAKGLTEDEIAKLKNELEKEIAKNYDFNWEHFKHRDALSESRDMKEQKERERVLNEKLMGAKQLIGYVCPVGLRKDQKSLAEWGVDSLQRQAHTNRIHDILGCYYTHLSEIPNQPTFQILNTNTTSESKTIKFDHDTVAPDSNYTSSRKLQDQKPLKGILKVPLSQIEKPPFDPKNINPNLIFLLNDIKKNPASYSKEQTEQALKPYRESGQLEYLTKNKDVLEMMLRNINAQTQSYPPRSSAGRQSNDRPPQTQTFPMGYPHTFVPKADKYRTVPCKYYHSHLGCNKVDNCTYIHDERYKGVAVPPNYTPPAQTKMPNFSQPSPATYRTYQATNFTPSSSNPPQPGYSSSTPYSNPGYYSGADRGGYPGTSSNYSNNPPGSYPPRNPGNYPGGGNPNSYQGGTYSNNPGQQQNYSNPERSYPSAERNYPSAQRAYGGNSGQSGGRNSEGRTYPNNPGSYGAPGNYGSGPSGSTNKSGGYSYPPPYYGNYGSNQGYGYYGQQGQNNNQKNN